LWFWCLGEYVRLIFQLFLFLLVFCPLVLSITEKRLLSFVTDGWIACFSLQSQFLLRVFWGSDVRSMYNFNCYILLMGLLFYHCQMLYFFSSNTLCLVYFIQYQYWAFCKVFFPILWLLPYLCFWVQSVLLFLPHQFYDLPSNWNVFFFPALGFELETSCLLNHSASLIGVSYQSLFNAIIDVVTLMFALLFLFSMCLDRYVGIYFALLFLLYCVFFCVKWIIFEYIT
jgi:hypothetical protein